MELSAQIKKYRTERNLSQEELAEKAYVSRQTISNWETGKNCPDVHSLVLLGTIFNVSLDQLIKGDMDMMKQEIKEAEIMEFNRYGNLYTILLFATIISFVPLVVFLKATGIIIYICLFAVTLAVAFKVERLKKNNDIQTYREIVAFMEGKRLDEIDKKVESGKRPYQKILLALCSAALTALICGVMAWIFLFCIKN